MARICCIRNVQNFKHMVLDHPVSIPIEILILVQLVNFFPIQFLFCVTHLMPLKSLPIHIGIIANFVLLFVLKAAKNHPRGV